MLFYNSSLQGEHLVIVLLDRVTIEAEQCRRDLTLFVKAAWPVIEPGTPLLWNWHLDALCLHLQAVAEGKINRLLINIAPGHAKSSVVSVLYPVWSWINDPAIRWLCASHSLDLAIRDNKNRRDLIESDWFQSRYGHVFQLSSSQNVKSFFENNKRGYSLATAVRSSATGKRGSHLLIDDPNNAMAGEADILAVKDWFGKTWTSRLNDQEHGAMVVVGQRLDERDLSGHILKLGGWTHLNLPEEFEPDRKCITYLPGQQPTSTEPVTVEVNSTTTRRKKYKVVFVNSKATNCTCEARFYHPEKPCKHMEAAKPPKLDLAPFWQDPRTEPGELLWPAKFPKEVIENLKKGLTSINYAAQFQQSPVPAGGAKFKEKWFRYFSLQGSDYVLHTPDGDKHMSQSLCWRFGTVDLAISQKQSADFTVFSIWDVTPDKDLILVKMVRGHFTDGEQANLLKQIYHSMGLLYWKIESVAYQQSFVMRGISLGIPCMEYNPRGAGDKVLRATPFAIWLENGKAYFPEEQSVDFMHDVKEELLKFPKGAHDDIVDTCSMAADEIIAPRIPMQEAVETAQPVVVATAADIARIDPFKWLDDHGGRG